MELRTWQFTNFAGLQTPPSILAQSVSVDVQWLSNSNQVLIDGVFPTGDESYQIVPKNIRWKEESIVVIVGVSRIETDLVMDVGRNVPYQIQLEFLSGLPDEIEVFHENERDEVVHSEVVTRAAD